MTLFVLSCKDGWVNIMYDGLDAVGVDQQVTATATITDEYERTIPNKRLLECSSGPPSL